MRWVPVCLAVGCGFAACGSDHELSDGASGGVGGTALDAGNDSGGGGMGGMSDAEPPGPNVVNILHGIVDAERVKLCFAASLQGVPQEPQGSPWPAQGLDYGRSAVPSDFGGLDPMSDDIQPIVIAGDLGLTSGLNCRDALALAASFEAVDAGADGGAVDAGSMLDASDDGAADADLDASLEDAGLDAGEPDANQEAAAPPPAPPPLRAAALPVIPAASLSDGRAYVLALSGCIGGPAFVDASQEFVCGTGYTPANPSLRPLLVAVSRRTQGGRLGLSVLHASRALDSIDVHALLPDEAAAPRSIASGVTPGALAPKPPKLDSAAADYGANAGGAVSVRQSQGQSVLLTQPFSEISQQSALSFEDGKSYLLLLLGPRPGLATDRWWNAPRMAAIEIQ